MKTFKIYTLGCKANQYDSQAIREQLQRVGLKELGNSKKADYYIINTCTVTNSADSRSRNIIRSAKRQSPSAKIVVTGCYAHSNSKDIKKIAGVDLILNNIEKESISEHLFPEIKSGVGRRFEISDFKGHTRAFVKVQDGCNNFCSFCKVPYVRGRSRSREFNSVVDEVKRLRDRGYKEVVLTGICLGDYGKDLGKRIDLVDLIDGIEGIKGILRIRLSSIEANDITDRLIRKMKVSKKLCPHLHIAFQSGDNYILKAMNRRDTRQKYLKLVQKLKRNIKNIGISADIMIGFPGEDDKKFLNTLDFLKKVGPMRVHIFTFNPRESTPLFNTNSRIPKAILKQRYSKAKELIDALTLKYKKRFQGKALEVLIEEKKDGFWQGYSQNYLLMSLKDSHGSNLTNALIKVRRMGANVQTRRIKLQRSKNGKKLLTK